MQERNQKFPIFVSNSYLPPAIDEDLPVGSAIPSLIVAATDPEGHPVHYYIDSSVPAGAYFAVNETSGLVTLAHAVDYERASERSFIFTVCLYSVVHLLSCPYYSSAEYSHIGACC